MNEKQSRTFLRGDMDFTPQRMMRYIRSRARLATDEDIEDILQNALLMVTQHFDPTHPDANLALYCLGACNKAIAQNLERYHKVKLKRRDEKKEESTNSVEVRVNSSSIKEVDGEVMTVKSMTPAQSFDEKPSTTSQYRTTSLDSMFDEEDGRNADDIFGLEYSVLSSGSDSSPDSRALINNLIEQVLQELPPGIHRTCFILKYVEGYKREDLIECLKMEPKSIDTIDKKIVRTLKAFKAKLDKDEARI
ncbi:hypothetical protein KF707_10595 [Candidatus Obscuribacterales bacterium]|nr:hypothetical protein [Candidatus Obscuribacterales bacterium]MBX3153031.1 hypothetical protein [Candidatus Obscuribacterales bacterium]